MTAVSEATAADGVRVTVVTTGMGTHFEGARQPVWMVRNGVQVCYLPARMSPVGIWAPQVGETLESVAESASVGHITSCWVPFGVTASRLFARIGLPYVSSPRGALNRYSLARKWWKKWPYFLLAERAVQCNAASLHATSPLEEADLRGFFPAKDVCVIPNICPGAHWADDREAGLGWRARHGVGRDRLLLMYVGRLEPKKNLGFIGLVQRAVARTRPCTFAVIGPSEAPALAQLQRSFRGADAEDLLVLPGTGDDSELRAAYSAADVFVLPSLQENFANVVVEAAMCGTPVVASPMVGVARMISPLGCASVVELSPERWARAVLSASRGRLGPHTHRQLSEMFSPSVVAAALRCLYRRLESQGSTRP